VQTAHGGRNIAETDGSQNAVEVGVGKRFRRGQKSLELILIE
jgi:hypothetical protein